MLNKLQRKKQIKNYNVLHPDADKNNKNSKNASMCKFMLKHVLLSQNLQIR